MLIYIMLLQQVQLYTRACALLQGYDICFVYSIYVVITVKRVVYMYRSNGFYYISGGYLLLLFIVLSSQFVITCLNALLRLVRG